MELRRANSSVGRALRLHRRCRGFESLFAHHSELQQARGFNDHAPVFNSRLFSILTCSQFSPVLNSRLFSILACSQFSPVLNSRLFTMSYPSVLRPVLQGRPLSRTCNIDRKGVTSSIPSTSSLQVPPSAPRQCQFAIHPRWYTLWGHCQLPRKESTCLSL